MYEWECKESIDCLSLAHLLSVTLYSKRFFPYFTFCLVGGIDKLGSGALFKYDALGSYERVIATVSGKGEELIQPILDRVTQMEESKELWSFQSILGESEDSGDLKRFVDLSIEDAIELVKEAFHAAAEREISIGDGVEIVVIERESEIKGNDVDLSVKMRKRSLFYQLPRH